jgi:predicted O-methyltransferase YrrM
VPLNLAGSHNPPGGSLPSVAGCAALSRKPNEPAYEADRHRDCHAICKGQHHCRLVIKAPMQPQNSDLLRAIVQIESFEFNYFIRQRGYQSFRMNFLGRKMSKERTAEQGIKDLYKFLLQRHPAETELKGWSQALGSGAKTFEEIFYLFVSGKEFLSRFGVRPGHAPGHFYSPVVNPEEAERFVERNRAAEITDDPSLNISDVKMMEFWSRNFSTIRSVTFPEFKSPSHRYYFNESPYPYGDAITLRAMIGIHSPKKIVEIGSGWSTACMLDSLDEFGMKDAKLICIEPYTDRLETMISVKAESRVTLLQTLVQNVDASVFEELAAGDILFIDSSHVLKTGSDVHDELFRILPKLKSGVLVHFHDIQYPFEYPDEWIMRLRFSWNEIYALRAFLMYNNQFDILFWNSFFFSKHRERVMRELPLFGKNPGSSLWLKVGQRR